MLHGEAVNDDVAFAPLVSLYGVNSDGLKRVAGDVARGDASEGESHLGDLVAVGNYDPDVLGWGKGFTAVLVDFNRRFNDRGDGQSFGGVALAVARVAVVAG